MIGGILDRVLGRGRYSNAVPTMDGPLQPNRGLDEAEVAFAAPGLDNLTAVGDGIWFSSGAALMRADGGAVSVVASYDAEITCLAAGPGGVLAVGLDGQGLVLRGGAQDGTRIDRLGDRPLLCATAAVFADAQTLIVAVGARDRLHAEWKRDLMSDGQSGEVWRVDLASGKGTRIAGGLAYASGVALAPGGVLVAEAWAHRLVLLADGARPKVVLDQLPGYPGRVVGRAGGGYLLPIFAPRNQLVEFVLREHEYRRAMLREVRPDLWIAPALSSGASFKEPLQSAALKTMGIIKPWAPSWSYGLLAVLDDSFRLVASFHSRADGSRHGVTSACEHHGALVAGARGAGLALTLHGNGEA